MKYLRGDPLERACSYNLISIVFAAQTRELPSRTEERTLTLPSPYSPAILEFFAHTNLNIEQTSSGPLFGHLPICHPFEHPNRLQFEVHNHWTLLFCDTHPHGRPMRICCDSRPMDESDHLTRAAGQIGYGLHE